MNQDPLLSVVTALAECLVSHPKDLRFEIASSVRQTVVTINGHRDDIGRLMGRECKNAKAIQSIAQIITEREARSARVNIAEGYTGAKGDARPLLGELVENSMIRRLDVVSRALFQNARIVKSQTSTHVTLTVFTDAPTRPEIEPALQSIFKAFGGAHNRFVTIEIVEGAPNESVAA